MERVRLPHDWTPLPHQLRLWRYLEGGGKRAVAAWHRRAGKDSTGLNWAAVAAHERIGIYWHMLPQASQGRKVVWRGLDQQGRRMIDQAFPEALRDGRPNDQEMLIRLKCGSLWQVVGSDNYDSLLGANPVGIVFSEWSIAKPTAWDYLRPILLQNGGWALWIFTPRGRNHAQKLFKLAGDTDTWFAERLTVEHTGILTPAQIDEERRSGMSPDMIRQEYYCSFDAAVVGAYYGALVNDAENAGRIGKVPYDPKLPVVTAWDLGVANKTAIWFCQQVGHEVRLIDYHEAAGVGLDHYAKVLKERPYAYAEHLLPHDVSVKELGSGTTRLETLTSLGIGSLRVLPQQKLDDGINAVRLLLPRCWFDAAKCDAGLEALRMYRREWDEDNRVFKEQPEHDWASDAADAFRYLAAGLRKTETLAAIKYPSGHRGVV